ncbi:hypothetical protein BG261_10280 [Floricoccus tropicus]|uniref:ABC transporter ATP-binding protein n=1 Tax=Floricoccus tropicus TaxID=1859473 RepID=A0A1E8GP68_9LACT|nr:ABC transporter ATP-binding protein [Floricoccus tropicus]OFI50022.1 hypothetical protein BG261_10280 [Floricoccus tropicus]
MKNILTINRSLIIITIVIGLISSALNVYAGTTLLKFFVKSQKELLWVFALVLCAWTLAIFSTFVYERLKNKSLSKSRINIKNQLTIDIYRNNYVDFSSKDTGFYISKYTNDVSQMIESGISQVFDLFLNGATVLFTIIVMYYYHKIIAFTAIILFFIVYFGSKIFNKSLKMRMKEFSNQNSIYQQKIVELINGFLLFKNYDQGKEFVGAQEYASDHLEESFLNYSNFRVLSSSWISWVNLLSQLILLFISALMAVRGEISYGVLIVISNIGGMFFSALIGTINSVIEINISHVYFESLTNNRLEENFADYIDFKKLQMESISYSYSDSPLLENINICINACDKVGLKGESGSGKSTLLKIILGLQNDFEGSYILNGERLNPKDTLIMFENSSYVGQNTYLFNESLLDNIVKFAPSDLESQEIEEVLEKLNMYDFVTSLDNGLNTEIKENGKNISGGQTQKIALARAILSGRKILIIDEATSALDEYNKNIVEDYLLNLKDKTIIFVSHKFSDKTIKSFDKIIEL